MKKIWALYRIAPNQTMFRMFDDYRSQSELATDLRCNGYKVVKMWSKPITMDEAADWEHFHRVKA